MDDVYGQRHMRTNIVLDDELVAEAMRRTGIKTKRAVVEEALRKLIRLKPTGGDPGATRQAPLGRRSRPRCGATEP